VPNQLHNELRKDLPAGKAGFQLERMILFSDAVFAIAITLLVIEIKIPDKEFLKEHADLSDRTLLHSLSQLVPKFTGFLISFSLIGLYWSIHHRLFGFVTNYNRKCAIAGRSVSLPNDASGCLFRQCSFCSVYSHADTACHPHSQKTDQETPRKNSC